MKKIEPLIAALAFLFVAVANYFVFMVVPNERVMGPVQRIFYFHVGSAFACYCSVAVMLIGGIWYLATRSSRADAWQAAAGEVGFIFCSIVLLSGMIWANTAWNTPFDWREPRLVSFLMLWLIFLGFNLLRRFGDRARLGSHSAVLSIVGSITVPIVVFSVKFLSHMGQLHPQVIENNGLRDPSYKFTFWFTAFALVYLQFVLVWLRARIQQLENRD